MSTDRPFEVLIVGASGVFGSRLAKLAAGEPGIRLTLAGRRPEPLMTLASELGACAVRIFDRDRVAAAELNDFDVVIDCAGPFQGSHTRLIEACIAAGVNYVDLADGRDFVCSIGRFNESANAREMSVITGASSIPALSHAVLDRLSSGWRRIDDIRVGIFPGNRAPRGRSVVEAILSYVGKPLRVFRTGRWCEVPGWSLEGRIDCGAAGTRWASVCDTPEQELLVKRYRPTRSAEFIAGLELPLLHLGLWLLSFLVRWRIVGSLRPAAGALLWIARQLRPLGSDTGAMTVEVSGIDAHGNEVFARWSLDATSNLGPYVPVLAPLALIERMASGWKPESGAYPCSGIVSLEEFDRLFDKLGIQHTTVPTASPLRAAA
jgi:saccharopine dehydrogenase-like NADP-dependent oxidoreductase